MPYGDWRLQPPPVAPPVYQPQPLAKAETALVLTLIGLCTGITAPIGVIVGAIAWREMKRHPGRYSNEKSALYAMIIGIAYMVLLIAGGVAGRVAR